MDFKEDIYSVIKLSLELNHSIIVENNDDYAIIDDKEAGIAYLALNKDGLDSFPLFTKSKKLERTVCVISLYDYDLFAHPEFRSHFKVNQYRYIGEPFELSGKYDISPITMDDYGYLCNTYDHVDNREEYVKGAIERGMLKVTMDGKIVAYIGEHPEHTIGLLYVDVNYRHQGIARELEKAMINKFLKENKEAVNHVELDNVYSNMLQSSYKGMKKDDGYIDWYCDMLYHS